jgi:hypothetical protein
MTAPFATEDQHAIFFARRKEAKMPKWARLQERYRE